MQHLDLVCLRVSLTLHLHDNPEDSKILRPASKFRHGHSRSLCAPVRVTRRRAGFKKPGENQNCQPNEEECNKA